MGGKRSMREIACFKNLSKVVSLHNAEIHFLNKWGSCKIALETPGRVRRKKTAVEMTYLVLED